MDRKFTKICIAAGLAALPLSAAMAQDTWYTRLVGASQDGAAAQMRNNGFRVVDKLDTGEKSIGYVWYSDITNQCIQVISVAGRVDSAVDIQTHPDCRPRHSSHDYDGGTWYSRLVGARAAGALSEMESNGFTSVDGFESGTNGRGTIWFNRSTKECIQMITVNGHVDSAVNIHSHPKCR